MGRTFRGGAIQGIRIATVFSDIDATVCAGCGRPIDITPFRVSIMDAVAVESPPSWSTSVAINPGPHQFHAQPACFWAWATARGYVACELATVRELMRPIAIPGPSIRWGLCDGEHREAHEFRPT
ncbi:MAG: hypothetical protein ACHQ02_00230 [Candidatus Limnocylindrales bacterium]|jgi:hypothetical protein